MKLLDTTAKKIKNGDTVIFADSKGDRDAIVAVEIDRSSYATYMRDNRRLVAVLNTAEVIIVRDDPS